MFGVGNNVMNYSNGNTPIWSSFGNIIKTNTDIPRHYSKIFTEMQELSGFGDSEYTGLVFVEQNGTLICTPRLEIFVSGLRLETLAQRIVKSFIFMISLFGLLGNGTVIWLLGFRMKRNPFTVYILNLSIADSGVLISLVIATVLSFERFVSDRSDFLSPFELFSFTFSTSQFLLVAISVDRCVAVFFPLWHRCHRPPYLSTVVCSLIWFLSFWLSIIHLALFLTQTFGDSLFQFQLTMNALLCTPLMTISTLTLFIKVCWKSQQLHRGKLVTVILLTLLLFLLFALPLNAFYIITYFSSAPQNALIASGLIFACLNSSVNPLIYFLVGGRPKKGQRNFSMKVALQRVFKEDCKETHEPTNETDYP